MRTRIAVCVIVGALVGAIVGAEQRTPRAGIPLIVGTHANGWNAAAVGINGTSTALDARTAESCSSFGNTSAAATLTVQYSADNTNFYSSNVNTGAVTGNFGINFTAGARYVRLLSNAAATITATLQCKGH